MAGFCFLLASGAAEAAIIYVNAAASGANNGTSWTDAYTSLQSALATSMAGDQIWVAAGVYKPSVAVDVDANTISEIREVTFQIKNGVKVYGGFAGGEATLAGRNWTVNVTILSGDIDNNDQNADANNIAENTDQLMGNNAYHVVYTSNVNNATLLDGFIITAGSASTASMPADQPNHNGAGWYNKISGPVNSSSPGMANCVFRGNYAKRSGAAWYTPAGTTGAVSEPVISGCRFIQNKADYAGGAVYMGSFQNGIYRPHITNSEFTGNRALRYGGALFLLGDAATMEDNTFTDNAVTVISPDGGTLPAAGGAIYLSNSEARLKRCMFIGNKATGTPNGVFEGGGGGAVYMSSGQVASTLGVATVIFESCGFYNNTASDNTGAWGGATLHVSDTGSLTATYTNCVFSGNQAQVEGGASAGYVRVLAATSFSPKLEVNFTNSTFINNSAGIRGGALYFSRANGEPTILTSRVENCIVFGNTAPVDPQIGINGFAGPVITYTLIQGGYTASLGQNGGNNISGDPLFVNAADPDGADNLPGTSDDGLRVNAGSPVVNAGNTGAAGLLGVTTDFAGVARLQGASVDMGAYETSAIVIPPLPVKYYWLTEWRKPKPGCLSCPWAIRFINKTLILKDNNKNKNKTKNKGEIQNFEWKSNPQLAIYADSAIVKGKIAAQDNPSFQFEVYLKLVKQSDWAAWSMANRTYSALTPEAKKVALQNYQQWTYWELSDESRLTGRAALSGSLKLVHYPASRETGFQFGLGANDQDGDLGLNGEFGYSGVLTYKKEVLQISGIASLNADATLCEKDCVMDADMTARKDFANPQVMQTRMDKQVVYPNPVADKLSVTPRDRQEGKYRFTLYSLQGRAVYQSTAQLRDGTYIIDTRNLAAGFYQLEIMSPNGKKAYYKVIH